MAVSREVVSAVTLLGLSLFFYLAGPNWLGLLATEFAGLLALAHLPTSPLAGLHTMVLDLAWLILPPLLVGFGLSLVAGLGETGLLIRPLAWLPDFSRLDPRQTIGRLFSRQALFELAKSFLKLCLLGYLTVRTVTGLIGVVVNLPSPPSTAVAAFGAASVLAVQLSVAYLLLAGVDYLVQRARFEASLRMTREELKEELRQTEGAPEVRRHLRQRQRRIARARMMAAVKTAQVVVTNPTHVAVALRYVPGVMAAPKVVAKGRGYLALRIRQEAERHGIEIVTDPPLAQALDRSTEVGDSIPVELYQAVAELMAVIYRKRRWTTGPPPSERTTEQNRLPGRDGS